MPLLGKLFMLIGVSLFILGVLLVFFGNQLNWFGNLPGDFRIKKEAFTLYLPLSSMILLSIIGSLFIWLLRRFI